MQRQKYNLGHQSHICGMVGRLQLLTMIPVVPGDSVSMYIDAIMRLAPLRKEIVQEGIIDIHGFYTPWRHVEPVNIPAMIKEGYDEDNTMTGISIDAAGRNPVFLGLNDCGASLPKWAVQIPNRIFDRYYRVPTQPRLEDGGEGFDYYPDGSSDDEINWRLYGPKCARLLSPLNGGTDITSALWPSQDVDEADAEVAAVSAFDVRDLALQQARYKGELKKAWMANDRYTDVLDSLYGTNVNIDADQRPEMIFSHTQTMSGTDINGTDDATLGSYIGKTVARVQCGMDRKFFPEHGFIHVFCLFRFPLIHTEESHPLLKIVNPTARQIFAEPETFRQSEPVAFTPGDWLNPNWTVTPDNTFMPHGQMWRVQPNRVHSNFREIPGYPFEDRQPATASAFMYHEDMDYDDVFQTSQIGHWQMHASINATRYSQIPAAISSIYVGTN